MAGTGQGSFAVTMAAGMNATERHSVSEALHPPELTASAGLHADPVHRQKVEARAGYGIPEADIARVLEIDPELLRHLYAKELEGGHVKANARVAESLYRKALGEGREAVTAAIFWLKTRAGWKETAVHEVSGKNGAPIAMAEQNPRQLARAILFALELGKRQAESGRAGNERRT